MNEADERGHAADPLGAEGRFSPEPVPGGRPEPRPHPVLVRPEPGETRQEFTARVIAAMREAGFSIRGG